MTSTKTPPPANVQQLRTLVLARYDRLSGRLQQVARQVLDQPADLAFETLAVAAQRAAVAPSAIVRFAQALGFDGATSLQRLLRDSLIPDHAAVGYRERVRRFNDSVAGLTSRPGGRVLDEFVHGYGLSLQQLRHTIAGADIDAAVNMIAAARTTYVVGVKRSFPIAAYLAYSLPQVGKRVVFLDGTGSFTQQQLLPIGRADLLLVISFHPYAAESVAAVTAANAVAARVLAITDSTVGPIASAATQVLRVREREVRNFRLLAASLCVAQALIVGLAFKSPRRRRGTSKSRSRRAR